MRVHTATLEDLYRTHTARQMAEMLGLSHAAIRQALSRAGIPSPRREKVAERRSLIRRLWSRGTANEIAEFVDAPIATIKRDAKVLGLRLEHQGQLELF